MIDLISSLCVATCALLGCATVFLWVCMRIERAHSRREARHLAKPCMPRRWRHLSAIKPKRQARGPARQDEDGTWSFGWGADGRPSEDENGRD